MNENFYKLPLEKRLAIINSGLESFGKYDYKKASTEEIASKAGISKGLLFHYFKNKEEYFRFILLYAKEIIEKKIESSTYMESNDFFEILEVITQAKCSLLKENPYILQFLVTAQCSKDEKVQHILKDVSGEVVNRSIENIMKNIDFSKFREDINPMDIIEILSYSLEGYIQGKLRSNELVVLEAVMEKYRNWVRILKLSSYK